MNSETFPAAPPIETPQADVVVVGAGIIGLAHAALAVDRGLSVIVIDRDHEAVGASVRNFGHCCITAQSGELYDLAQAGRRHWLDFAERAGFWAAESGALVVARTRTELAVLRELSEAREPRQVVLLGAEETAAELGRTTTEGIVGGARLRDDLRVDPRATVGTLAGWLNSLETCRVLWNTSAFGFGKGSSRRAAVQTSRGPIEADQIFVCVGHDVDYLLPEVAASHGITRCSLQMALAHGPQGLQLGPAVLTATSMLRYRAFTAVPSAAALRAEVAAASPELLDIEANVMFTQRPDGTLLIGDSHSYAATQPPFLAEATSRTLLAAVEEVLRRPGLNIAERWQGIYASSPSGPLLIDDVADGVTAVSVTAGVGMTISFGLAERNTTRLLPQRTSPAAVPA